MINPFPLIIAILLSVRLGRAWRNRNLARVGGKIGRRRAALAATPIPDGFSRVESREITVYGSRSDAAGYSSLQTFMRNGTFQRDDVVRVYRVAACKTRIEIPAGRPDYERIDAAEALTLLRELPDLRLVLRLHLSDEPSFLDPWVRNVTGREIFHLGHATNAGLIVLYRPDRGLGRELGLTLLHEWVHLLAFKSARSVRRFNRANSIEPMPPMPLDRVPLGGRKTTIYEAWAEFGERLFGYDEAVARQTALALPVHAMIVWQQIDKILRSAPAHLRSTRRAEFQARATFMTAEVAPEARAARASRGLWLVLRQVRRRLGT